MIPFIHSTKLDTLAKTVVPKQLKFGGKVAPQLTTPIWVQTSLRSRHTKGPPESPFNKSQSIDKYVQKRNM